MIPGKERYLKAMTKVRENKEKAWRQGEEGRTLRKAQNDER